MHDKNVDTNASISKEVTSVNSQNSEQKQTREQAQEILTPLMHAALAGKLEDILDLLSKGAKLEEESQIKSTAVMFSAQRGHLEATQLFLEKGADFQRRNNYKWNAFLYAIYGNNIALVEWMMQNPYVTLNEFDVNTGLLVASMNENLKMILLLFKYAKDFIRDYDTILKMENPYKKIDFEGSIKYHLDMAQAVIAIENNAIEELDSQLQYYQNKYLEIFSIALKNNRSVRKLSFRCDSQTVVDNIIPFFKNNPMIEELTCSRNDGFGYSGRYVGEIFNALLQNSKLKIRKLDFYNSISEVAIPALGKFIRRNPNLKELRLENCKIGSEKTKELVEDLLEGKIQLEKLDLSYNKIGIQGAKAITNFLRKNTTLKFLSLSGNHGMNEGIVMLCDAIAENDTLEELNLSSIFLEEKYVKSVENMLSKNKSLKKIDLGNNYFHPPGDVCIVNGLIKNNVLEVINLSQSNPSSSDLKYFNAETAKMFGELFKTTKTLIRLNLSGQKMLGNEGSKNLAEGLKENTTLQSLDFYETDIEDEGLIAIVSAIRKNTVLKHLRLEGNKITDVGAKEIAKLLEENNVALECLSLENNRITTDGYIQIFEALRKNDKLKRLHLQYYNRFNLDQKASEVLFETLKYFNLTLEDVSWYKADDTLLNDIKILLNRNKLLANKNTSSDKINEILNGVKKARRDASLSENPYRFKFNQVRQQISNEDKSESQSALSFNNNR